MYDFCNVIRLIVNDVYPCDYFGGRRSSILSLKRKGAASPAPLGATFTFPSVSNSLSRPIDSEAWCEAATLRSRQKVRSFDVCGAARIDDDLAWQRSKGGVEFMMEGGNHLMETVEEASGMYKG
jgi:hypothetical protein